LNQRGRIWHTGRMPYFDVFRSPSGNPESGDSEFLGIVPARSTVEAVAIAGRKVTCVPPAALWACEGDVDDTVDDVIRLDRVEDRSAS